MYVYIYVYVFELVCMYICMYLCMYITHRYSRERRVRLAALGAFVGGLGTFHRRIRPLKGLRAPRFASAPGLGSPSLPLHRAHPSHICTGTGLTPASSCTGTGLAPCPHLRRDWAHPCLLCAGTGLKPGLHLRQSWAHPCRICAGTGLTPPASPLGLIAPGKPVPGADVGRGDGAQSRADVGRGEPSLGQMWQGRA